MSYKKYNQGILKFNNENKCYYLYDLAKGSRVSISPTQQDVFNDELISNYFPYVTVVKDDGEAENFVIIQNPYSIVGIPSEYQFSLKPSEIDELDMLKKAVQLLYNRTGPTSFQFSESLEYGRTVHVLFDDFNIIKEITDKSKPNIE